MRTRFKRLKRRKIGPWPDDAPSLEEVARKSRYVGSPEHKSHPSEGRPPALRSDVTFPCEPHMTQDMAGSTAALRRGIEHRCTSAVFEGGYPRYVWTWIEGHLYEARHINGPRGTYKGYRLEPVEHPDDPERRLEWDDQ